MDHTTKILTLWSDGSFNPMNTFNYYSLYLLGFPSTSYLLKSKMLHQS
jgi:hypothetical protein